MASNVKNGKRVFFPSDVCRIFNLPRTTLFRWESEGKIPNVPRRKKDRYYLPEHMEIIKNLVLGRVSKDYSHADSQIKKETQALLEERYRAKFIYSEDQINALNHLQELGVNDIGELSPITIQMLVDEAMKLDRGDEIRKRIWKLLTKYDDHEP